MPVYCANEAERGFQREGEAGSRMETATIGVAEVVELSRAIAPCRLSQSSSIMQSKRT